VIRILKCYSVKIYFPANNIYNDFIHEDEIKGESQKMLWKMLIGIGKMQRKLNC